MKINHILDVWIICKYFRGAPLIHSQFSQQVLTIYIYSRTMKRIEYFGIIIKKSTLSNSLKCRYFLCHYIHDPFFKNLFWNLKNFENDVKTRNFFRKNEILTLHSKKWIPYFLQTFFRLFATFCTFSEKISIIRNEIRAKSTNPTQNRRFWVGFRGVLNRI